ncbi:interferon lambda-2-like [Bufo gargarizans]|uniref:interferon lambda-2-like n=1 Tax=Bufo gargarizans TaxID=30331 RepID=UPI001CF5A1A8|nr:interferon lambda-2-like [Bufo gargarizans]
MTGRAAGFASEAMMIGNLSLDVLIFENYYTCVSPFMVDVVSCEGFIRREESLQIDTNTSAMDVRLVVFCILFVAVTGHPHKRRCLMSRYKSVSSTDIKIIRELQNEHEKDISTSAMKCYRRMMRHKPSVCDLNPSDRLILTLERVTITTEVLANLATSDVPDPVLQSLMMFLKIRDDLLICRESSEYSSTPSDELMPWLHHLQYFLEEASPQCLQVAVLLSLISLMVEDVGCWAHVK